MKKLLVLSLFVLLALSISLVSASYNYPKAKIMDYVRNGHDLEITIKNEGLRDGSFKITASNANPSRADVYIPAGGVKTVRFYVTGDTMIKVYGIEETPDDQISIPYSGADAEMGIQITVIDTYKTPTPYEPPSYTPEEQKTSYITSNDTFLIISAVLIGAVLVALIKVEEKKAKKEMGKSCIFCNAENPPEAEYCMNCGRKL